MRDLAGWTPSKFEFRRGQLRATRNRDELAVSSRLIADLVARWYGTVLPAHATGRLLDLGCGKVPLFEAYRQTTESVTCVDWRDGPHIDQACDLTAPLPLPSASFDTIILSDVLEHLPEPALLWAEMARLLTPGGKVLLNVPFFYQIHEEPHDYYRYTRFALARFAETNGFQIVSLEVVGGGVEVLSDLIGKLLKFCRMPPLSALSQIVAIAYSRTSIARSLAVKTGERIPLGYGMIAKRL